jgi:coproporphyrinogen III oxidase-like Fe-S oxidoreductase
MTPSVSLRYPPVQGATGSAVAETTCRVICAPAHCMRPGTLRCLPPLSLYVHLPWCLKQVPVLRLQLA